jgi:hypothetical protein
MRLQRQRLGMTQAQVAAQAGGLSARTVLNYERGRTPADNEVPGGYYRIEPVIGWAAGSVDAVLAGGEPVLMQPGTEPAEGSIDAALSLFPQVTAFGQLCTTAGAGLEERAAFDDAAARLLDSVPGMRSLVAKALRQADLGIAALRPHGEGEPIPLDDMLRAIRAADRADSNTSR